MKKLLTIILSMLMVFSSCLMVTADETYSVVNDNLKFRAYQNDDGDLIFNAEGDEAKEFIDELGKVESIYNIRFYMDNNSTVYYNGQIRNTNNVTALEKIDDNSLKISKANLIEYGFVDGDLNIQIYKKNSDYSSSYFTSFEIDKFNIGKQASDNKAKKLNVQFNVAMPAVGASTEIDQSKVVVKDEKGNQLSVSYGYGDEGYYAFWAEEDGSYKNSNLRASVGCDYVETADKVFEANKTYYLAIQYHYSYTSYNDDPIEISSDIDTEFEYNYLTFTNGNYKDGKSKSNYFDTTNSQNYVSKKAYEAEGLKKEEAKTNFTKDSKVSASSLNDSVADLENKILDEGDKEKLKNGAEIKTYLEVSDNNVSESDKKIVEKNVENKLKSNTIAQILDIKLIKEITQSSTTTIPVTYTNGEVEISLTIDDSLVNKDSNVNREYKVVRVHHDDDESEPEVKVLDATYDASTKSITFKTDKFSTYAICYKDTKKEEKKEETNTSSNTSSTKVVTCEEAMGSKNWTWSESKKACVYRVTNTSAK